MRAEFTVDYPRKRCSSLACRASIRGTLGSSQFSAFGLMSDFNISYSIGSLPSAAGGQAPLWSFNSVKVLPCMGNTVTLHNSRNNQGMLVQSEVAHALSFCAPFRSMDAHLEQILAAMPPLRDNPEDVRNILTGIRDAGFLESAETAWQRLTADITPHESAPARVFILTCDRPAALDRLLNNMCDLAMDPAIESLWIIDDSKQPTSQEQNAKIIADMADRLTVPVQHVDDELQRSLCDHLMRATPQHQASLSFLLDAERWLGMPTYGRARNMALLLSVGYRALVLDDDIVLQAIAPPRAARGLRLATAGDREAEFYESQDALAQHALDSGHHPLAHMLGNVGKTVGDLVHTSLSGPADLVGWNGKVLAGYSADSPVLLNQCGSWGDPGTGDGSWIFFLPEPSIKSLMASGRSVEQLLSARANWIGYRGPTLSAYGTLSQLTGFDHRALLPPYFPAGRGEDVLFGIMLQRMHPESLVLSEGWAIRHEPLETRVERGQLAPLNAAPNLQTLADWLGREPEDEKGLTPERRLLSVSDDVRKLSEMNQGALERLVGEQLASKRTSLLARCTKHLEQAAGMETTTNLTTWSEFLSQTQAGLIEALQNPEPTPLSSLLPKTSVQDIEALRTLGDQLACAIAAWPEVCEAAKSFRP